MADGYTGVILAFFLRPSEAEQLALPGGEAPDQLHITLGYLGDQSEWTPENLCDLCGVVMGFAKSMPVVAGRISGCGRFTVVADGEKTPIYASVDSPHLGEWRHKLVKWLQVNGFSVNHEHGFTPHITLDYIDKDAPTPSLTPPPLHLLFDALTLAIAGKRYSYPLQAD